MIRESRGLGDELKKSVLLTPAVLVLILFFLIPIFLTVYYSFTNLALNGEGARNVQFIGLENYSRMMTDPNMINSIVTTLIFLVGSLIGQQILGFFIALMMKGKNSKFRSIIGPFFLAGWIMPEVVVALCSFAFFDRSGTLNAILQSINIPMVEWLYKYPLLSVIIANVWHGMAFSMINFQSALDNVPGDIEEAARVDGANYWQRLFYIIIPHIKNTIATNTMLNTLSTLGVFGLIYTMTGGGPGVATQVLPIFMYKQAFVSFQLGYGTAISMVLLVLGLILSILYARIIED